MELLILCGEYAAWHYSQAIREICETSISFLWLIHSAFSHAARAASRAFPFWPLRILSVLSCFAVVCAGLACILLAIALEAAALIIWMLLPLLLFVQLIFALRSFIPAS